MNILVISRAAWRNDNNTGNTLSNLFCDFKNANIYSMCFREKMPDNGIAIENYTITEQQIIKNIFHPDRIGKLTKLKAYDVESDKKEQAVYSFAKKGNSTFLKIARELIWSIGRWKNKNFYEYLNAVKPDIIFFPVFNCYYPHKVLDYVKKNTSAKIVLFHADDNYSLKQFSLSPLYWIYRFRLRHWIRKSVSISCVNYCISNLQASDYQREFHVPCELLCKWADFSGELQHMKKPEKPFQLVFTGNISSGRWKTLRWIGEALDLINQDEIKAQLLIYTATSLNGKMSRCLTGKKSIRMMGCVPASDISRIQENADVLVHAESFNLRDKLEVRLSFSTKIVDYLSRGRCILAVGPADIASIDYFIQNDAGIVVTQKNMIKESLLRILNDPDTLTYYALKAWEAGKRNHNAAELKQGFFDRLNSLLKETTHENITG